MLINQGTFNKLEEVVYKKYLIENITKTYKNTTKARVRSINKATKKFAEKIGWNVWMNQKLI